MNVDLLLDKLEKVRKRGPDSWLACCPYHADRSPSLTIRELDDGRILLHCFAGCPPNDVLASLGLTFDALFPERLPEHRYKPLRRPFPAHDVLAALTHELTIAQLMASDLVAGRSISAKDKQRLAQATERIRGGERLANGER